MAGMFQSNMFQTAVSGLKATQRALDTTGHNIANVNTDGYSRQRVEQSAKEPFYQGAAGYVGSGVKVDTIRRMADEFVNQELRGARTELSRLETVSDLAGRMDSLMADDQTGLSGAMNEFFSAAEDVANNPADSAPRVAFLNEAESLVSRFQSLDTRLQSLGQETNDRIASVATEINSIARNIAEVNEQIRKSPGREQGDLPNDLLDERERLLNDLSERINVSTTDAGDGTLSVFVGKGEPLVLGDDNAKVSAVQGEFDPRRMRIVFEQGGTQADITDQVTGGRLSGLLEFRGEVLEPARQELGRVAAAVTQTFNQQHRQGQDLDGNLGGNLFSIGGPAVYSNQGNTTTDEPSVSFNRRLGNGPEELEASDYRLSYDGSDWQLERLADGTTFTDPAGQFLEDGLNINAAGVGGAAAGDSFLIRPTAEVAGSIEKVVSDPDRVAAAGAVTTEADAGNTGTASLANLRFDLIDEAPPSSDFQLSVDGGGSLQLDSGPAGWNLSSLGGGEYRLDDGGTRKITFSFQDASTAVSGDAFTLAYDAGGISDNRNMLELSGLQTAGTLDGGRSSFQEAYGSMVAEVGSDARQATVNRETQEAIVGQLNAQRESVSGVNLDEEAANLIKYQQSYQAMARVLTTADTVFQSLLGSMG